MAFRIVKGSPHADWYQIAYASTAYLGGIVKLTTEGIAPLAAAAAGPSVIYPFGIVIGLGVGPGDELFNTTYNAQYLAGVATQALVNARKPFFIEGMQPKGEQVPMAKVALIDSTTIIEGPIRNAAIGTAPGVVTCTTASTDGLASMVHGNCDVTLVANNNMYYGRSGANAGSYRTSYAASRTTPTFRNAWMQDWTVGDTFAVTNFGLGRQLIDFDSVNMWIENSSALTSNYFAVDVLTMDLSVPGNCRAQFRFIL